MRRDFLSVEFIFAVKGMKVLKDLGCSVGLARLAGMALVWLRGGGFGLTWLGGIGILCSGEKRSFCGFFVDAIKGYSGTRGES